MVFCQPIQKASKDAYLITRMAAKFHIQSRTLNEKFSADLFDVLLKKLDREKIFLTEEDIKLLAPSKYSLHKEITAKGTNFLQSLFSIYQKRLQQADAMIDSICKSPFNFTVDEKYTVQEDTSYAANSNALRLKMYKNIKLLVLEAIAQFQYEKPINTAPRQKQINDSLEIVFRKKAQKVFKRYIQKELNAPGGIAQVVSDEYCKAIALCYDPHTAYMSATDRENFEKELGRKSMIFGFGMDEDDNGKISITGLQPGSPAFKSGMMNVGDKLISIKWDDQKPIDVSDASAQEVSAILDASNHAKATITIQKADGTKREVVLYKEQQTNDDEDDDKVKSFVLNGSKKIGYIYLPSFYEDWEYKARVNGCANDVAKEIVKLKRDKIDALILDIRFNGGGSVQEAVDLAGIFIDAGPITQLKSREGKPITLKDMNRGTIYDGPLAVLVNGYSASASELLAGALQDYNRAVIIGSNTYGKATGQRVLPLDTTIDLNTDLKNINTSAYLKLTLSEVFRVSGSTAQFAGIVPDIHVPDYSEAMRNKEKDELFAIPASAIDANKYYLPLAPISFVTLKTKAAELIAKDTFFKKIETYIKAKKNEKIQSDISLKLSEYLKAPKAAETDEEDMEDDESAEVDTTQPTANTNAVFTVENNSFEAQRIQKDNAKLLASQQQIKRFADSHYLKIVYSIMLNMIK
jgi:carboxyl-terminal processing protease